MKPKFMKMSICKSILDIVTCIICGEEMLHRVIHMYLSCYEKYLMGIGMPRIKKSCLFPYMHKENLYQTFNMKY